MDNQTAQALLDGLLIIKKQGPGRNTVGLCDNLSQLIADYYSQGEMDGLFKTWEHYSGEEVFPVPGTNGKTPESAYLCANVSIWDRKTKYGQLRWSLLEHCIAQLQILLSKP